METSDPDVPRARRSLSLALLAASVAMSLAAPIPPAASQPDGAHDPFGPGSPEGVVKKKTVTREFFSTSVEIGLDGATSWPALDVGAVRTGTKWRFIETSPGVYSWTRLDRQVATVEAHGATPLVVIGGTPRFHVANPDKPTLTSPPRLAPFRRFVRALVERYGDRVDYQVWNEPNVSLFFDGTPAQMAAMTKVVGSTVRQISPASTVVAPSFPLRGTSDAFRVWFRAYWGQTLGKKGRPVGKFVDAASISAYPLEHEDPEDALALTQWARRTVARSGFHGPLWATEINYGASGGLPTVAPIPMDRQVAYVIRTFALHATAGADRVYWWNWDGSETVNTHLNDGTGSLTPAGVAFGVVEDWLLGTRPKGCTVSKATTRCRFRVSRGLDRYVYWTRSGRPSAVRLPAGAVEKTDPQGRTTAVSSRARMRVGLTPKMVTVRR